MYPRCLRLQLSHRSRLPTSVAARQFSTSSPVVPEKVKDYSKDRKMSALEIQHMHRKGNKIAMITAYDYPSVRYIAAYDVIGQFCIESVVL